MNNRLARRPSLRSLWVDICPSGSSLVLLLAILLVGSGCVEKKMTVADARKVTVDMAAKSFDMPPRRVSDVLELLDQPSKYDQKIIADLYAKADSAPPDTKDPDRLAWFYFSRGQAARELGRYRQGLEDFRLSNQYRETSATLRLLSTSEAMAGNFRNAIAYVKRSLETTPHSSSYFLLALYYTWVGDLVACERTVTEGLAFVERKRLREASRNRQAWLRIDKHRIQATLYNARGQFAQAEPHRREAARLLKLKVKKHPLVYLHNKGRLDMNLAFQGRLIEAEMGARVTLNESIGLTGKISGTTADSIVNLGEILAMQGRLEDAEQLIRKGLDLFEQAGMPQEAAWVGAARSNLVKILVARQQYPAAARQLDGIKVDMADNAYDYNKYIARDPDMMIPLVMTGRAREAMETIAAAYRDLQAYLGDEQYQTAEMLGLRGMAHTALNNQEQARKDFSKALPVLFKERSASQDHLKNKRIKVIAEAYIDLLAAVYAHSSGKPSGVDIPEEIFQLCESINSSLVKQALGASGARAAAVTPELADLVRREQDASKQIESLKLILANLLAAPPDQVERNVVTDLQASIATLGQARRAILVEIQNRFPRYEEFVNPQVPGFDSLRQHLKSSEALVVIYPAAARTYIWGMSPKWPTAFAIAPLGRTALEDITRRLRQTLSPVPGTLGDIPDYDLKLAHELFTTILKPVAPAWQKAGDLIIVAAAPLGTIPFAVLPTAPVRPAKHETTLFAAYRKVPWLIRQHSLTRLPSVSSLVTLRSLPPGNPERRTFTGFGDPYFNVMQMRQAAQEQPLENARLVSRGGRLKVRGIRVTQSDTLDSTTMASSHIGMLSRLPDTAEEINGIGATLGADPSQDIYLGARAAENRVKTMDLSNRKVIAFATHGLVAGDLDGLDQPALALSGPDVTRDAEDGLLTAEEILGLKLNADWIVLSACNTGAAQGAGAEAVSGLGRSFFYAGSRALLVSMWPVETTSAKMLTTGLFRFQEQGPGLSRAKSLQKSILHLLDRKTLEDASSGKTIAAYAHPFFWAPFIVVGDGG